MRIRLAMMAMTILSVFPGIRPVGAAVHRLVIRDTVGRSWRSEPVVWSCDLAPGEWKGGQMELRRDGKPIVSQARSLSRYPDGSVKKAEISFLVDALPKDGKTEIRLNPGKRGPADTDLRVRREKGRLILANAHTAVKLIDAGPGTASGNLAPIQGIRTASGGWTGGGEYRTATARPVASKTELIGKGPARLAARVTTTFSNGRRHVMTVNLWSGSRSIDIDEEFDVGPDTKYRFKEYRTAADELAWEWWSWYGDRDGTVETHPNNWVFSVNGPGYEARDVAYWGESSTDSDRGNDKDRGRSGYRLTYDRPRRLEKYLTGHAQWRPDAVLWYATSANAGDATDSVAVYAHSVRKWRNPNVTPLPAGITLRTGANDPRIWSASEGRRLEVECPIGRGHRDWAIRVSTRKEMLSPRATSPTALDAERVQRCMGLDITRHWITDWAMDNRYPRLFVRPEDRAGYYTRFKGKETGITWGVGGFLNRQDRESFDKAYDEAMRQADAMILGAYGDTPSGYAYQGMDLTVGYPAWMLGYWHGIVVAAAVDNLLGSPLSTPEKARALKKKLAILTYCLTSKDAWPDKRINYGWGSMNMPVGRWGGLAVMASALSDHPMAKAWLKDAPRYFDMLLATEFASDGSHKSCPHYIGAGVTSFYSWLAMANCGLGPDMSRSPVLRRFALYYMRLMTPVDPRWGIRTLLTEGDTRPGSSSLPGILASFFKKSDPELAGRLMRLWIDGGRDTTEGMGIPDNVLIDETVPPRAIGPVSEVYSGFGAFLRAREPGTREESYLAFVGGSFMIDHANEDQLAFAWYEKGVPLSTFNGAMYNPFAYSSLSHNTISWDVKVGGGPAPGKDQPGNWYADHHQPFVDLPWQPTTHRQVDRDEKTQSPTDSRGKVTRATESDGAALIEGRVPVRALTETPTRIDNYALATAPQAWPPPASLATPFTWTRRLLSVTAPKADGMNYLVIRDDFGGDHDQIPFFSYWAMADDVAFEGNRAHFTGSFGVDTDMIVLAPEKPSLFKDTFVNTECEPIVSRIHQERYGKAFSEKNVLCRAEGRKGQGFLVVLFPYRTGEERPVVEPWQEDAGAKITWKGETHYVLLDARERVIDAAGIRGKTSAVVAKVRDSRNASIALPAGGKIAFAGHMLEGANGKPVAVHIVDGGAQAIAARNLMVSGPSEGR